MPLLLIPLLFLGLVLAWLLLLPLILRQRYRSGSARRRAIGWLLRFNAWGALSSLPFFVLAAWLGSRWSADALRDALVGLAIGGAVGAVGLLLTRFESADGRLHYTPNRWLTLGLTALIAVRIAMGMWTAWHRATGTPSAQGSWTQLVEAGGLWAVGGILLGYAVTYAWGLHRRHVVSLR